MIIIVIIDAANINISIIINAQPCAMYMDIHNDKP